MDRLNEYTKGLRMEEREVGKIVECVDNLCKAVEQLTADVKEIRSEVNAINKFKERLIGAILFFSSGTFLFLMGYVINGFMGK